MDQRGFTLLEVSVCTGVLAVLVMGAASVDRHRQQAQAYQDAIHARDELVNLVRQVASSRGALRDLALAPVNSDFLGKCFKGQPDPANFCESMTYYPLSLVMGNDGAAGAAISGPGAPDLDEEDPTGVTPDPRRYSRDGRACPLGAAASPECPFEIFTVFRVQCKPALSAGVLTPAVNCTDTGTELVGVRYLIRQAPGIELRTIDGLPLGAPVKSAAGEVLLEI